MSQTAQLGACGLLQHGIAPSMSAWISAWIADIALMQDCLFSYASAVHTLDASKLLLA